MPCHQLEMRRQESISAFLDLRPFDRAKPLHGVAAALVSDRADTKTKGGRPRMLKIEAQQMSRNIFPKASHNDAMSVVANGDRARLTMDLGIWTRMVVN